MSFRFINSFKEIQLGDNLLKDDTGKINVCCYSLGLKIIDYNNLKYYYRKNSKNENSLIAFNNILESLEIKEVKSLLKLLSENNEFTSYEFQKNSEFNPFIKEKEIEGKLQIKIKKGRVTKAQIKKILSHKETNVVIKSKYSDDYAYDYAMDYFKGVKISRLDVLYDVFSYFDYAVKEKDDSITLTVAGNSKTMIVTNKSLEFIE